MAIEFFLLPQIGSGTDNDPFRPKYAAGDQSVRRYGMMRYSRATDDVIAMIEADQLYLDSIAAQSDATRIASTPTLDEQVTPPQVNAIRSILEAAFIPEQFVNVGDTRRQIIRGICGMFIFSQRMSGQLGAGWKAKAQSRGITLNSAWQDFPQIFRDEIATVIDSFGWTPGEFGFNNATTLREIMQAVSERFESTALYIAGFEL